jgi:hypothetical protein
MVVFGLVNFKLILEPCDSAGAFHFNNNDFIFCYRVNKTRNLQMLTAYQKSSKMRASMCVKKEKCVGVLDEEVDDEEVVEKQSNRCQESRTEAQVGK